MPSVEISAIHPCLPKPAARPRARGVPVLGALPRVARGQFEALREIHAESGELFDLDLGLMQVTMACHPDLAEEVLIQQHAVFERGGKLYEPISALIGQGLPATEGEVWRRHRRMMQPHFHNSVIARLCERVAATLDEVLDGWAELADAGAAVDVEPLTAHVAMSVAVSVVFGAQISAERGEAIRQALAVAIDGIALGWLTNGLPRWLPAPGRRRFERAVETIDEHVFAVIDERRRSGELGDDLLGLLLESVGDELDEQELRDEVVSLFLAGYETTGNALSWGLAELARDAEALASLRAEADAVLGALGDRQPSFAELRRLGFARQVFDETLRMYPPAMWIPRVARRDTQLGGYPIAAGETVMVSIYNIHHHPEIWPEPERFMPERFAPGADPQRHKLAFMPFGAGKHLCIGKALAMLEGALTLAKVAQRFDLRPAQGRAQPKPRMSTTLRSTDGVWLELRTR